MALSDGVCVDLAKFNDDKAVLNEIKFNDQNAFCNSANADAGD